MKKKTVTAKFPPEPNVWSVVLLFEIAWQRRPDGWSAVGVREPKNWQQLFMSDAEVIIIHEAPLRPTFEEIKTAMTTGEPLAATSETSEERRECPDCQRMVIVNKNGKFRAHGPGFRCGPDGR